MGVRNPTVGNVRQSLPSKGTVATPTSRAEAKGAILVWKARAPVAIAAIVALLPVPSGLAPHAGYFFSIFVGVIVGHPEVIAAKRRSHSNRAPLWNLWRPWDG